MKRLLVAVGSVVLITGSIYLLLKRYEEKADSIYNIQVMNRTYRNYAEKIESSAEKYHVPKEYLLALIALECSGKKLVPHRFEPKVYNNLKLVQNNKLDNYDHIKARQLKNLSDRDLKKLASSWGPFQLMGYKKFELGCSVDDLNSKKGINYGVRWISETYGYLLKKGRFKDAFHVHNTGRNYPVIGPPLTFHRNYVPQGLKYMDAFKHRMDSMDINQR